MRRRGFYSVIRAGGGQRRSPNEGCDLIPLGMLLALLCAFATNLSLLLKYRGARAAPAVSLRHPVRSARGLLRSRCFSLGMLAAIVAWCLHVSALALAPLSLIRAISSAGLVLLTVLGDRSFGCAVGARQWWSVSGVAIGLVLLAVMLPSEASPAPGYTAEGAVAFEATMLAAGLMLVALVALRPRTNQRRSMLLGVAAGLLFGVCDVAIKAMAGDVSQSGAHALVSAWPCACLVASPIAFYASARSLQTGEAIPVIASTTAAVNVSAISAGILVFGDPMQTDPVGLIVQSLALAMVVTAAALVPAPARVAA